MDPSVNLVDWLILAITLVSALVGFFRGFIRETLSLVAWILAFWVAFNYGHSVASLFVPYLDSAQLRIICGFVGLFVVTLLALSVLSYLFCRLLLVGGIAGTDRILGGLFGIARAVVLVAVVLLLARLTAYPQETWWKQSLLIGQLNPVVGFLHDLLPPDIAKQLETV